MYFFNVTFRYEILAYLEDCLFRAYPFTNCMNIGWKHTALREQYILKVSSKIIKWKSILARDINVGPKKAQPVTEVQFYKKSCQEFNHTSPIN